MSKTMAEMTAEYNSLVESDAGKRHNLKRVRKFQDLKTAQERIDRLKVLLSTPPPVKKKRSPFEHS